MFAQPQTRDPQELSSDEDAEPLPEQRRLRLLSEACANDTATLDGLLRLWGWPSLHTTPPLLNVPLCSGPL